MASTMDMGRRRTSNGFRTYGTGDVRKHNTLHHTYTNIDGSDDDIDVGFFARISPHQRRLSLHRYQHVYLWFLYALLPMKWQFVDDFYNVATGRIASSRIARPKGGDLSSSSPARQCSSSSRWSCPWSCIRGGPCSVCTRWRASSRAS